jgi:hypothetical protein
MDMGEIKHERKLNFGNTATESTKKWKSEQHLQLLAESLMAEMQKTSRRIQDRHEQHDRPKPGIQHFTDPSPHTERTQE